LLASFLCCWCLCAAALAILFVLERLLFLQNKLSSVKSLTTKLFLRSTSTSISLISSRTGAT
jgi:hypothetical protein